LARDGAKVVLNYNKDSKGADDVVAALNQIKAGTAIAVQADVSKSTEIDRLFAEAKRTFGGVDIVIANSGVAPDGNTIATTTNESFDRVISVNLTGVFYTLRAAANYVRDNGRIMVIGSGSKVGTIPGYGPYAATKAAIEVLSNTLAQELGSKGITVNAVHPGK
jgi:3-oxoacyl-[acyl-carrier protein] reductase